MTSKFYHDDPDVVDAPPANGRLTRLIASIAILLAAGFFIQTTLAANISLGTAPVAEFGQGILQTTACSQGQALLMVPKSEFANTSGAGNYKFSSFTVSNIPSNCHGVDFSINAYESATNNSPLPLFNSAASTAVIYDNNGTFESNVSSGLTVTTLSATSFRATFDSPVSVSTLVSRVTIQSGPHTALPCNQGGVCSLGETGPGGGKIFYVNVGGFSCGASLNLTCKYLEAAPNNWYGGSSDPTFIWADAGTASTYIGVTAQRTAVGTGYANTMAIINQPNGGSTSAGAVRAYSGGGLTDWYLGNVNEMIELDNAQAYVSPLVQNYYATSEESSSSNRRIYGIADNSNWYGHSKNTNNISYTRPIRAF